MKLNSLFLIALLFVAFIAYFRYIERRSVFFPMRGMEHTPADIGLAYREVFFKTKDGLELNGWLIPAEGAVKTVLFFHGNAGNISHRLEKIRIFHELNLNVFIFDYRGYGKSEGRPSEKGLYLDGRAAYAYLTSGGGVRKEDVLLFGESLGGCVAIDLAGEAEVCAVVVESAFSSAKDLAKRIYPFIPAFALSSEFDSVRKVKAIRAPKLFIHSEDDEIVPFDLGRKLFESAPPPKTFLKIRGGHNTAFLDSEREFKDGIRSFISVIFP